MKPRRPVSVAPLSTSTIMEASSRPLERTFAFAHFGDAARAKLSKDWRKRDSQIGDMQMDLPTKSRRRVTSQNLSGARSHPDRSFEFILSPKWWSEARSAKDLFLTTRDLLAAKAVEGRLKVIHPALRKVLGCRENPFLEVPMMEFLPQNDGRGRAGKRATRALALYFEVCYECGDGSSRWLSWNILSRPDEHRLYGIARDITEAKSQADLAHKMHRMFHVSEDLFCVLDSRGSFLLANPAFQKLLGFPPQRLLRTAFSDLLHHRDRRKATASLESAEATAFFVARCGCHPTGYKRIAWRLVAVPPEDSIYCVGRNVTGLKVVGRPAADEDQVLIDIAQLSNDINNPLEAVLNLLFLLKNRRVQHREHKRYIELAEEQVFRIARVLKDTWI